MRKGKKSGRKNRKRRRWWQEKRKEGERRSKGKKSEVGSIGEEEHGRRKSNERSGVEKQER